MHTTANTIVTTTFTNTTTTSVAATCKPKSIENEKFKNYMNIKL